MNEPKHQSGTTHLGPILGPHKGDPLSRSMNETPKLLLIQLRICQPCLDGIGEMCHTPECALCRHMVDLPINPHLYEVVDERAEADCATMREALERMVRLYESEQDGEAFQYRPDWLSSALSIGSGTALLEEVRRLRENSDRLAAALEGLIKGVAGVFWSVEGNERVEATTDSLREEVSESFADAFQAAQEALAAHRKGGVA